MKRAEQIIEQVAEIPIEKSWSFEEYKPSDTAKWSHGYHRYPAKFIPQLVERLFDEYIQDGNAHVNDPFMGSGTTIVSAISRGFIASGTDINGIAYLMTKVKATPIDPKYLDHKIKKFWSRLDENMFQPKISPYIPTRHEERIDYWFSSSQKRELGKILRVIYEESDQVIRDFLLVAFSNILKNCSIWLQSSTKPTRDRKKDPIEPKVALKRHLRKMLRGNRAFYKVVPPQVKQNIEKYLHIKKGDAQRQAIDDESVDLIVSSSPYVTSYEYADLHQLSTIWLDFAADLKEYRKEFIGTAYKENTNGQLTNTIAKDIVRQMQERNEKMAQEIETYFIDMQSVFEDSYRILKSGGRCCYVIGNTRLRKVDILNAEAFALGLQEAGFVLDRVIKREIPSKILPQNRDEETGRFASNKEANSQAYPTEYIIIGLKE